MLINMTTLRNRAKNLRFISHSSFFAAHYIPGIASIMPVKCVVLDIHFAEHYS